MLPPPPPPSFAQAWSSISLRTNVNTQEKFGNDGYAKFFLWRRGGGGGGGVLKRCIMGNVKMVSYHPRDYFFFKKQRFIWARQSYLGLQRLHHLP